MAEIVRCRIVDLDRYGDRGWQWTTKWDGEPYRPGYFSTDGRGSGLWSWHGEGPPDWSKLVHVDGRGWRQVLGTGQFSLPAARDRARRAILRYHLAD